MSHDIIIIPEYIDIMCGTVVADTAVVGGCGKDCPAMTVMFGLMLIIMQTILYCYF